MNSEGDLIVTCQIYREQTKNLQEAIDKLREIIYIASIPEKEREFKIEPETEPMEWRRINSKRKKSEVKKQRQTKNDD